jgi:hypothetical protein
LKPLARAAGARVVAAELLLEVLEALGCWHASVAVLDLGLGGEALSALAGGLKRRAGC